MNFQDASNLQIPEGYVRTIHDKDSRLLWGSVGYDVSFDGNATQQTYSGKNLFDIAQVNNLALGTTIVSGASYRGYSLSANAGDTFTLSRKNTTDNNRFRVAFTIDEPASGVAFYDKDGNPSTGQYIYIADTATSVTFTVPVGMSYAFIYLSNSGQTITESMQIQIEKGSTITSYEPFVGGTPAPNPEYPQPISVVTGENVVKVVGKNLFDNTQQPIFINSAKAETIDTGVRVSPLSQGAYRYAAFKVLDASQHVGETITLSLDISYSSANDGYAYIGLADATGGSRLPKVRISESGSYSYTIEQDEERPYVIVVFYASYSQTTQVGGYSDYTNIQLELGSTATSYEAFTAQEFEVNLGKNLSPTASVNNATWASSSVTALKNVLNSLQAGTYSISMNFTLTERNDTSDASKYGLYLANSGGSLTDNNHAWGDSPVGTTMHYSNTFTISQSQVGNYSTVYLYGCGIQGTGATGKANVTEIQIELGQPTPFAPYFTPLELAKIGNYQDRIYKTDGKWYVEKQVGRVVLDGSESWTSQTSNNGYMYRVTVADVASNASSEMSNLLSDYFTPTTGALLYSVTSGGYMAQLTVAGYIRFNIGDTTDKLADFKSWLSTHNTTVYYALATPTTTEITDATLIAQLEAVYDWVRRHGYNASVTGDLPIVINRSTLS